MIRPPTHPPVASRSRHMPCVIDEKMLNEEIIICDIGIIGKYNEMLLDIIFVIIYYYYIKYVYNIKHRRYNATLQLTKTNGVAVAVKHAFVMFII